MKRLTLLIILFSAGWSLAQTTPNLHLNIPNPGTANWNVPINSNFTLLDSFLSGGTPLPGLNVAVSGINCTKALFLTNTDATPTNPNKYFRVNASTGALELVNSVCTQTIASFGDAGGLQVFNAGSLSNAALENRTNSFTAQNTFSSNNSFTGVGQNFSGNTVALTADWTCGTGGTVASCTAATIIGSGGGVPLTFTLPLVAQSWTLECDGVVGQATAATANNWNLLTATNGATNVTTFFDMYTAATAKASGATTDQASTTTTFNIGGTWTLGGTATKMPFHIWAKVQGASASGTVLSLQLVAPTVGDLVTIYQGSSCRIY